MRSPPATPRSRREPRPSAASSARTPPASRAARSTSTSSPSSATSSTATIRPVSTCSRNATHYPPCAVVCARRRSSARSSACWPAKASLSRSGALSASWATTTSPARSSIAARLRSLQPPGAGVLSWARALPDSRVRASSRAVGTQSRSSNRFTPRVACSPTASPSSVCPRPSWRPRSSCSARWAW